MCGSAGKLRKLLSLILRCWHVFQLCRCCLNFTVDIQYKLESRWKANMSMYFKCEYNGTPVSNPLHLHEKPKLTQLLVVGRILVGTGFGFGAPMGSWAPTFAWFVCPLALPIANLSMALPFAILLCNLGPPGHRLSSGVEWYVLRVGILFHGTPYRLLRSTRDSTSTCRTLERIRIPVLRFANGNRFRIAVPPSARAFTTQSLLFPFQNHTQKKK